MFSATSDGKQGSMQQMNNAKSCCSCRMPPHDTRMSYSRPCAILPSHIIPTLGEITLVLTLISNATNCQFEDFILGCCEPATSVVRKS